MENVSYLCIVTCEVTIHRHLDAQISRRMLAPYTERLGFLLIPMSEEIWKPVLGYEGLYEVSNLGRVKSLFRRVRRGDGHLTVKEKIMDFSKVSRNNLTYYRVPLSRGNKKSLKLVSNLVCEAFHGRRPNGMQCSHINENSIDNRACNLMWSTIEENNTMPIKIQRQKEAWRKGLFEHLKKPVLQFTKDGSLIAEHESCKAAARASGVRDDHIISCCKGRNKSAGGYIWKYKEQ